MTRSTGSSSALRSKRLLEAEKLLARGYTVGATVDELCSRWGVTKRQAKRYVRAVRRRWQAEWSSPERRAQIRDRLRASYHEAMRLAWQREDLRSITTLLKNYAEFEGLQDDKPLEALPQNVIDIPVDDAVARLRLIRGGSSG